MDAGEWTEVEPEQDRGPESGCSPPIGGLVNSLSLGGVTLTAKSEVHSFGVHLDPVLTMETQVMSVVHSAYFYLWQMAQLHPCLDIGAFTTLV